MFLSSQNYVPSVLCKIPGIKMAMPYFACSWPITSVGFRFSLHHFVGQRQLTLSTKRLKFTFVRSEMQINLIWSSNNPSFHNEMCITITQVPCKMLSYPLQALTGPSGSGRLKLTQFLDILHMKVVRLSALCTGHPQTLGNIPGTHFR